MYRCGSCLRVLEKIDLKLPLRCPYCGYRVLYKTRPNVVKKVIAR